MCEKPDEGRAVDMVYLDFEKPFGKVLHNMRLGKRWNREDLEGIYRWITNWLNTRRESRDKRTNFQIYKR